MEAQTIKQFSNTREARARQILDIAEPQELDENTYLVPSQNSSKKYKVTHIDSYSCECEDFKKRCKGKGLYCKHIKAILLFEKLKAKYEVTPEVKYTRDELIKIFDWANNLLRKEGLRNLDRFVEFSNILFIKIIREINGKGGEKK